MFFPLFKILPAALLDSPRLIAYIQTRFRPGSSRSTPVSQHPTRNVANMMYPQGNYPAQPQASQQPIPRPTTQYGTWAAANSHAYSPLQRRNTTAVTLANHRAINQAQGLADFSTRPRPASHNDTPMKTFNPQQPPTTMQSEMIPTSTMDTGELLPN